MRCQVVVLIWAMEVDEMGGLPLAADQDKGVVWPGIASSGT